MVLSSLFQFAQDATTDTVPTELPTEVQSEITNQLNNNVNNLTTTSTDTGILAGIGLVFLLFYLVLVVFYLVCSIKIFQKAGRKWWEAIVPIYNVIVLLKIVGRPVWWVLLLFIPFVNLVVSVILAVDLAKVFKKDAAFGVLLLWLLSFIGYPMLAFGSATYAGPGGTEGGAPTTPQSPSPQSATDSPSSNPPTETPTTPDTPNPADTPPPTQPPQSPPTNLVQ